MIRANAHGLPQYRFKRFALSRGALRLPIARNHDGSASLYPQPAEENRGLVFGNRPPLDVFPEWQLSVARTDELKTIAKQTLDSVSRKKLWEKDIDQGTVA